MLTIILSAIAVVVVVVLVALVVRVTRSRSERADWLGELSEIRRSSLGDDEEVTGVIEAVSVVTDDAIDDADPDDSISEEPVVQSDRPSGGVCDDPASPSSSASVPRSITDHPTRTVSDAGTLFNEYEWDGFGLVRIGLTDPRGLRVLAEFESTDGESPGAQDPEPARPGRVIVDLPHGLVWLHGDATREEPMCTIRTPAGWVNAKGAVLVVVSEENWTYVMCPAGTATVRSHGGGDTIRVETGGIARVTGGDGQPEVIPVGVGALDSEGMVRRHRRLDGRADDADQMSH